MNTIEAQLGPWTERPGPLHVKLTDALRDAIDHGYLVGGDRLPSERELAKRLAVSRSTVVTAYDTLRSSGLLESRQGSGTRVRPTSDRSDAGVVARIVTNPVYRSLLTDRDGVISLAAAVLPADPCVAEAFADFASNEATKLLESHNGYTPAGLPELREQIAVHLTEDGIPTTMEQVVVTTGAQQAVNLAALMLVQPGDDVVVESPSFAGTIDAFRTRGARLPTVPVDDDGVDVRGVRERIAARRPSALYVMPSYHNPTGAQLSESRRRELAELATSQQIPIIEDNALEYSPLSADHLPPIAAFADPDAPVLSAASLSKAAWGGLRIGWLRGPAPLVTRLAELKAMTDLGSPLIGQAVATRIVPQLPELRERHRVTLQRRLEVMTELLTDQLPEWQWTPPRGGPSLWVRLPAGSAAAFAQVALRHGVEVIPGEVMSPDSDHRDYMRLPFTGEPAVLEETVRRLTAAWRAYAPREDPASGHGAVVV